MMKRAFFGEMAGPLQQVVPVRVGGEAVQRVELGFNGYLLSRDPHGLRTVDEAAPKGTVGLVADEKYMRVFLEEVMFQMVHDTPAGTHAAAREYDAAGHVVDGA